MRSMRSKLSSKSGGTCVKGRDGQEPCEAKNAAAIMQAYAIGMQWVGSVGLVGGWEGESGRGGAANKN